VLGHTIDLAGRPFTIVGVMPRGFQFPIGAQSRDMWLTFSRDAEADDPGDLPVTAQRGNHFAQAIARLKPGVSLTEANADLSSIARALASTYIDTNKYVGFAATRELEFMVGDTRPVLYILFGVVGIVLLIACANLANLLLSRNVKRSREIAIRCAVGATRSRVVRQLLTESVLLSLLGAVLGLGLAQGLLDAMVRFYPSNLPRAGEIEVGVRVILFTAGLAFFTGILFGIIPALRTSSPNLMDAVREGGRTSTAGVRHNRLRSALVVGEMALGIVLLISAGLLLRSLERLMHTSLGFNPKHVVTANFDLSETRYNPDQQDRFVSELLDRLRILPGVTSAAGTIPLPLSTDRMSVSFNWVDRPVAPANEPNADFYLVTRGFFEALEIPLVRGRTFNAADQRNSPPVIIVSESFARQFFPNENAIGKRIKVGAGEGPKRERYKTREIVGIVGDIRTNDVARKPTPAYFIPLPQLMWGPPTLMIRSVGDPKRITSAVRYVLSSMDHDAPLYGVRTMEDYLALDLGRTRFQAVLLSFFAGIALLLTAVGMYGVIAYAVTQRTQEIGLRLALGARPSEVLAMMLRRGVLLTASGLIFGVIAAAACARVLNSLLYEVRPWDPLSYTIASLVLSAVALLATYLPALRATRVNPIVALRYD
jgi:putative ABC transport system permease protein